MNNLDFNIYIIFTISWFLHLGSRFPILGLIRFDLLLVCILFFLAIKKQKYAHVDSKIQTDKLLQTDQLIRIIVIYSILTIPFVEWPGSVVRSGIEKLIKAIVFYYFTISFIDTETKLKKFILIFISCQLFRILEPLYLNLTQGYWGDIASMANWEYLNRLSGAPSDVVNPNGLAFIVCTVLPFLYYAAGLSWINRLAFMIFTPLCIYVLMLTGSRSGFLGLIVIFLTILIKSKKRVLLGVVGVLVVVIGFPLLDADMQDRYFSILGKGEKNLETAEGRSEGVIRDLTVALRRPIFGHGLGTSREANANYGQRDQLSHNLYTEIAQELGFVGLIIFLFYIKSIFLVLAQCKRVYHNNNAGVFLSKMNDAMQTWLWLNLIFSFASYGLTSYEWYLLGGFAVVMQRLVDRELVSKNEKIKPYFHRTT